MARRFKGRNVHGILILDKPPGFTSNDALQKVKHLFKAAKAGHTGSLDRLATGLLPICLGEATKISAYLLEADKKYEAVCTLGMTTTTADAEGEVLQTRPTDGINQACIEALLPRFTGAQMQVPPMHSALKRQGQPLYKLARQGITVEREARPITVFSIDLLKFEENRLHLRIHCSKGTYIRTLAEDIGEALGCGAYLSHLRRTGVGPYQEEDMWTLESLQEKAEGGELGELDKLLLPVDSAVSHWPLIEVSETLAHYMTQGQPVQVPGAPTSGWVRICVRGKTVLFALGEIMEDGRIAPKRLLKQG
jgi:tRNA pseudouridine55 synthase